MKLDKMNKDSVNTSSSAFIEEVIPMEIDSSSASHIIRRLTDLYADPIKSTIREIISNAIDTTKNLKEDDRRPIEVSLPTGLNKVFSVEDFGEGMSKETISEIYSQYGASTKVSNMNQIGAYGLGAKSPLSYCSQFTVESTKDGFTTELIVSSESGGNYTRFVSHEKTDKENGTKISVPIRDEDISSFIEGVEQYRDFLVDVEMNIDGEEIKSSLSNIIDVPVPEFGEDFSLRVFSFMNEGELIRQFMRGMVSTGESLGYFLSGWDYSKSIRRSIRRSYRDETLYVELLPGVMNFSSSREEITEDARFNEMKRILSDRIMISLLNLVKEKVLTAEDTADLYSYASSAIMSYSSESQRDNLEELGLGKEERELTTETQCRDDISIALTIEKRRFQRGLSYSLMMDIKGTIHSAMTKLGRLRETVKNEFRRLSINALDLYRGDLGQQILVVTGVNSEDDAMKIVNRLNRMDDVIQSDRLTIIGTKHSDDKFLSLMKGKYNFKSNEDIKFITIDELVERTKKTRTKVSRDGRLQSDTTVYNPTGLFLKVRRKVTHYQNLYTDFETVDSIVKRESNKKFLVIHKNARSSFDSAGLTEFMLSKVDSFDDKLQLTHIRATGTSLEALKKLVSEFDYIFEASNVVYDNKETRDYMDTVTLSTFTDETLVLEEGTPVWMIAKAFNSAEIMMIYSALSDFSIDDRLHSVFLRRQYYNSDAIDNAIARVEISPAEKNEDALFFNKLVDFCSDEQWLDGSIVRRVFMRDQDSPMLGIIRAKIEETFGVNK